MNEVCQRVLNSQLTVSDSMNMTLQSKTHKKLELYIFHYIFLNSRHPLLLNIYQIALLNLGDAHEQ